MVRARQRGKDESNIVGNNRVWIRDWERGRHESLQRRKRVAGERPLFRWDFVDSELWKGLGGCLMLGKGLG